MRRVACAGAWRPLGGEARTVNGSFSSEDWGIGDEEGAKEHRIANFSWDQISWTWTLVSLASPPPFFWSREAMCLVDQNDKRPEVWIWVLAGKLLGVWWWDKVVVVQEGLTGSQEAGFFFFSCDQMLKKDRFGIDNKSRLRLLSVRHQSRRSTVQTQQMFPWPSVQSQPLCSEKSPSLTPMLQVRRLQNACLPA